MRKRLPFLVKLNLLIVVFFIALSMIPLVKMTIAIAYNEPVPAWAEPYGMLASTIAVSLAAFHFGLLALRKDNS